MGSEINITQLMLLKNRIEYNSNIFEQEVVA